MSCQNLICSRKRKDDPLRKVVVNDTEPQSERHNYDSVIIKKKKNLIMTNCKINPNLAKVINEIWGKRLTWKHLVIFCSTQLGAKM